jgi:hypothetical protein
VVSALNVGQRIGVVATEEVRGTKETFCRRNSGRIDYGFGNRGSSATEGQRALEVFKANANESETSQGPEFIVDVLKIFGKLAPLRQRRARCYSHLA